MDQSNMNFLNELYSGLREFYGSIQRIADRTGYDRETVRYTLIGKRKNNKIIREAGKVLAEYRKERSKAISCAQSAINYQQKSMVL